MIDESLRRTLRVRGGGCGSSKEPVVVNISIALKRDVEDGESPEGSCARSPRPCAQQARCVKDVVISLTDSDWKERASALQFLCKTTIVPDEVEALPSLAAAIIASLEDSETVVRKLACEALSKMNKAALAPHAAAIVARLEDVEPVVRSLACQALGRLDEDALAPHAAAIAAKFEKVSELLQVRNRKAVAQDQRRRSNPSTSILQR